MFTGEPQVGDDAPFRREAEAVPPLEGRRRRGRPAEHLRRPGRGRAGGHIYAYDIRTIGGISFSCLLWFCTQAQSYTS